MVERRLGKARWPAMQVPHFSHSAMNAIKFFILFRIMWTGTFVVWLGVILIVAKHEPGGGAAASLGEDQVDGMVLVNEEHITGLLSDDAARLCGQVVEDHSVFGIGVSGLG